MKIASVLLASHVEVPLGVHAHHCLVTTSHKLNLNVCTFSQVIKELKAEMPAWVSKYARGGSARTVSARKLYVVVDAISGHFASNG